MTSDAPTVGVVAGPGVSPFEVLPHNCFACGSLNANGLRLLIHVEPKRAWLETVLDARFEGWEGIVHGGILCTILDEVMAWSLVAEDNWGLTARLSVEFKQPARVGRAIRAEGQIVELRRRVVRTSGHIVDASDGSLVATAEGTYVAADAERKRQLRDRYGFRLVEPARRLDSDTPAIGVGGQNGRRRAKRRHARRRDRRGAPCGRPHRRVARSRRSADVSRTAAAATPVSDVTARAVAFVAARRESAEQMGADLAHHIGDPDEFAAELRRAMQALADPEYVAGQQLVAPGIGTVLGVRWPLNAAIARGFRRATRRDSPTQLLFVADRLFREERLELRWFAFDILERLLASEPERTWQLLRRASREASDWITVDSLAHPYGRGILLEPYRWAELEQLVFSPSRWERRLVGSTIATMPFIDRRAGREPEIATHGLELIANLIGDDEPDVQKALAWALRSLVLVDAAAVASFCSREAAVAAANGDGHRAWVIRDTLPKLPAATADAIRKHLDGIRRRPGAPSTSRAAETAARFGSMGLGGAMPEPPLA